MKDKLIAAGIHLGISLLVAGLILVLLFVIWFPAPLMGLGAVQGVQLILLVDLAIGPLLTLIVFKKGKPSLVMDISVIVGLQIAALVYGLSTVYSQTPSFLVLTYEGLYVVNRHEEANYLEDSSFSISDEAAASPVRYGTKIPVYLMSEPEDPQARSLQNNGFMFGENMPYYLNVEMYRTLENFNHLIKEGTATIRSLEGDERCTEVSILSAHGSARACLELEDKLLRKVN